MGDAIDRAGGGGSLEDLEPPAPSRDDTRYPRSPRRGPSLEGRGLRRAAILALIVAFFAIPRITGDPEAEPDAAPAPAVGEIAVTPEVRAYLRRVERVCRDHDRTVSRTGAIPVWEIARRESAASDRIASVRAPADAREIRRRLLAARRAIDRTARWSARVLSESAHPNRTYRQRVLPVINRRVRHMYLTFGSFRLYCDTQRVPRR